MYSEPKIMDGKLNVVVSIIVHRQWIRHVEQALFMNKIFFDVDISPLSLTFVNLLCQCFCCVDLLCVNASQCFFNNAFLEL